MKGGRCVHLKKEIGQKRGRKVAFIAPWRKKGQGLSQKKSNVDPRKSYLSITS